MAFFKLVAQEAVQIKPLSGPPGNEKGVQRTIEQNLGPIFGARFVATEFVTGAKHRGRIDTLGLDEDGSPIIVEYKRHTNENLINQGLFYLDWLMDHRGDFEVAAGTALGQEIDISWGSPRLILLAGGFSRYDQYAVNRIDERIELWSYTFYQDDFLRVERLDTEETSTKEKKVKPKSSKVLAGSGYSLEDHLAKMDSSEEMFDALRNEIMSLGSDITERFMKQYIGYRRLKNFCEVVAKRNKLNVFIDGPVEDPLGIGEDYSQIGHWGTGNTRVIVESLDDIPKVMSLVAQTYKLQD